MIQVLQPLQVLKRPVQGLPQEEEAVSGPAAASKFGGHHRTLRSVATLLEPALQPGEVLLQGLLGLQRQCKEQPIQAAWKRKDQVSQRGNGDPAGRGRYFSTVRSVTCGWQGNLAHVTQNANLGMRELLARHCDLRDTYRCEVRITISPSRTSSCSQHTTSETAIRISAFQLVLNTSAC